MEDMETAKNFGVLSNVLLVLILIFITIYNKYKIPPEVKPSFLEDVKSCMLVAMKYVLGATIAIGLFYGVMSTDVEVIRSERIKMFEQQIATEEGLQKFYQEVPNEKNTSREDLIKKNIENVETFVSTKTQVVGGFVTLTFVSFVYTLLAVLIWRTVMKRN